MKNVFPMRVRSLICTLLVLLCTLNAATAASAAATEESGRKTVRVGWFTSDLFQEGGEGEPKSGYAYDYLRKLAGYSDWEYVYVYGEWSELYEMLCRGKIDFLAGVSETEERRELMLFPSTPMETDQYYLFRRSNDSSMNPGNLSGFDGKKIGLLENNRISDYTQEWLSKYGIAAEIVWFSSFDELHEAFLAGKIDLEPRTMDGAADSEGITAVVSLGEEPSYLAVNRERPDLLEELEEAISCMTAVDPYVLQELEYNNYGSVYTSRTVTDEERDWIRKHPVIRVGYMKSYLPYCAMTDDGQATGLMTDVLRAIFDTLEIDDVPEIEYIAYTGYQSIVDALTSGEIDIGFPVDSSQWRLEQSGIYASSEVVTDRGALFYAASSGTQDIRVLAVNENNILQDDYTKSTYPDAVIAYYPTISACLDAVLSGDADGTIMDTLRVQYVTGQYAYRNLSFVQLGQGTGKCFGVAACSRALLMLLNRGLKILGDSYGYECSYKYVDAFYSYTTLDYMRSHTREIAILMCLAATAAIILLVLYIRRQKRELAEKEELRRRAEEASAAKSAFLFNMSHDIRTPMNAVLGFNELMRQNLDNPEKTGEYVEKIRFSGEYLLGLINHVLEVARIDSGRETLDEEIMDLHDDSCCTVIENEARRKHLSVTRNIRVTHRYVYTDRQKIREILLNILSNAVKYTPDGGSIRVELEELPCDREGYASYVCRVADTGIGMTREFQEHIFETFAREHNTTESGVMGTGLGMAIVKKLVDLMGGTIGVESAPGKGTTFTIRMELRLAQSPEELEPEQPADGEETHRLDGRRILLAEDNDLNAEIATAILENLGAAVETACDGVQCIDMLQRHESGYYDLILMDIQMPNLDGYGAARKIRALGNPALASIPIIAMTANAFDEDRRAALDAGMNGHVAKPIDVDILVGTIRELLG